MYKYIQALGSKISSFFGYIFKKFTTKQKKYKTDDNEDEIVWYDNIYYDNNKNFMHVNLLDA